MTKNSELADANAPGHNISAGSRCLKVKERYLSLPLLGNNQNKRKPGKNQLPQLLSTEILFNGSTDQPLA